jgi:hypothetical protein
MNVFPDYVDINEPRGRTLTVRHSGNTAPAVAALFAAAHRTSDLGLERAWADQVDGNRVIRGDGFELLLGTAANHELSILLVLSGAYYLEQQGPAFGSTWHVLIDPFEVSMRQWEAHSQAVASLELPPERTSQNCLPERAQSPPHPPDDSGIRFVGLSFTRAHLIEETRVAAGDEAADRVARMSDDELRELVLAVGEHIVSRDYHLHALEHCLS